MFAEIDADVYVIVDGDATYDAASAPRMVDELVANDLDMVTAIRDEQGDGAAYRRGHRLGNRAFNALLGTLFGARPTDMLSGYRVLSRRFAKSFPAASRGFEIETELTVHALEQRAADRGDPHALLRAARPGRRASFRRIGDGLRILWMTAKLYRDERPLAFFGIVRARVRRGRAGARRQRRHRIHGDAPRAAISDGDSRDGPDAARLPRARLRPDTP